MRCIVCDASDTGLSTYRPDGNYLAKRFHETHDGTYCSECYQFGEEVLEDWYLEETEKEEDDGAFEYE